jgi:hypothetical protein
MKILCLAAVLAAAPFVHAQSSGGQIAGRVTDPSDAAILDARITIGNIETGVQRETRSNESGAYAFPLLQPGKYRITAQKEGFRPVSRSNVNLQVDQVARVDFQLQLGAVSETVEVTAEAPLLSQDTSALGQVVDNTRIVSMPLNGRSTFRLVQLTTNVLSVPSTNGQFGDVPVNTMDDSIISINGGRAKSNEILIDGIPSTTGFVNQMTTIPSVDGTQEFKVQSNNLSAEWGRFGGGVINVSTKSGTNQIHGTLFHFLRNSELDANEFFNKRAGSGKPPFRMNQFGFALGGPVIRNRTFFFGDYQGTRWRRGDVFITTVPTALERSGDFSRTRNPQGQVLTVYDPATSRPDATRPGQFIRDPFPGNVIPRDRIDPVAARLIAYYPSPNTAGDPVTGQNNYVSNASRGIDQMNFAGRVDHNVTSAWRTFGRFAANRSTLAQPDVFGNVASPGVGANGRLKLNNYTGGWDNTVTVSPTAVLNVRYGLARFFWARPTRSLGFDQRELGMPDSLVQQFGAALFPVLSVEGYSNLSGGSVLRTGQDTHSVLGSVSKLQGRHSLKAGWDVRLRRLNSFNLTNGGGNYSFTRAMTRGPNPLVFTANSGVGMASLLLGAATAGNVNIAAGNSLQNWYYAGYVQDDFQVTRTLTINVGVRYETESPYTERRNQMSYFSPDLPSPVRNARFPNLTGALQFATEEDRYVYDWDRNNFAPRAGFAWSLLPKTVIRGGAGLFYAALVTTNSDTGFTPGMGFSSSTPMLATLDSITPYRSLSNPFPDGLIPPTRESLGASTFLGQGIDVWDRKARTPYNWQWNLDVQRELPWSLLVDVAYAGSKGTRLNAPRQINALDPRYLSLGNALQAPLVANPFAGQITAGALSQSSVAQRQLLLPFPQFTSVNVINDGWGNSIYHSLAAKVEKRFSQGVTFLLSYTAGRLISDVRNAISTYDNATNAGLNTNVQNWYDLRSERALSELDVSRQLAFTFVTELPFGAGKKWLSSARGFTGKVLEGWQLSGVTSYRNGYPLQLSAPVVGGGNRPNSTGRSAELSNSRPRSEQIAQWFDRSAFTLPDPFTFGNVGRTLPDVRGPSFTNLDAALVKNTSITEAVRLQLRFEGFNVFNTPHFWLPNTALGNLQFGTINSTTGLPRVLQVSAKLLF